MLSGASSNNLGDGGQVDGATGKVKESPTPNVKQTPRKKPADKQPAGGGGGGGGGGRGEGGVRHSRVATAPYRNYRRYGAYTWCAGLVPDPQAGLVPDPQDWCAGLVQDPEDPAEDPAPVCDGALEVAHAPLAVAHPARLAVASSSSSSSALLGVEGGGHGTWHGTWSTPRSAASGDGGDVLEQQRWRCVAADGGDVLERQSISICSTPRAVRGAPEGGEGERGRVATGGATTAGSGGGGGVGRQEMEMERQTDRLTERDTEKVEMVIRAARPSSPRARCAREEWGNTGLRVREWLLARVQAAGVGCRV